MPGSPVSQSALTVHEGAQNPTASKGRALAQRTSLPLASLAHRLRSSQTLPMDSLPWLRRASITVMSPLPLVVVPWQALSSKSVAITVCLNGTGLYAIKNAIRLCIIPPYCWPILPSSQGNNLAKRLIVLPIIVYGFVEKGRAVRSCRRGGFATAPTQKSGCLTAIVNKGRGLRRCWLATGPTVGHSEAPEHGTFMEKFLQRWTKIRP